MFIRQSNDRMKLREEDIERIARVAENSIREYIHSNMSKHEIEDLDISVEVESNEDLKVNIEVNLSAFSDNNEYQEIVEAGIEAADTVVKNEFERITKR